MEAITPRLESVAEETAGELVWFEGKPAFTPYTRDCGGRQVPEQKGHPDVYCTRAGTETWQWDGDPVRIVKALADSGLRAPQGSKPSRLSAGAVPAARSRCH